METRLSADHMVLGSINHTFNWGGGGGSKLFTSENGMVISIFHCSLQHLSLFFFIRKKCPGLSIVKNPVWIKNTNLETQNRTCCGGKCTGGGGKI